MTKRLPDFIECLEQLIATPSVSSAHERLDMSNQDLVSLLADWFEELGFSIEIHEIDRKSRKQNLVATIGSGTGGLIFSGHTDTVPYDAHLWHSDPFRTTEIDGGYHGLGTTDMKGFFAVIVETLKDLDLKNLRHPLTLVATADEESSMSGARYLAKSGLTQGSAVVIGEPTNLKPIRMHKGIAMQSIRINGSSGHSSNPELGNNALEAMHTVISALKDFRNQLQARHKHAGFDIQVPTMNFGCIHGGDNPNRICGQCELQFDLRPLPGMQIDNLRTDIDQLLAELSQRLGIHIEHDSMFGGVEAFEEAAESELVRCAEAITQKSAESVAFATEAPFFQSMGKQTLILGPGSIDHAHQPNEFLPLNQIQPAMDIYRQLTEHYCF